ncbi:hypothetical protein scyTo_0022404, partial [Scyliorhinus torazame]|nr:hypothetical protein [Scyliorhinus torazame]
IWIIDQATTTEIAAFPIYTVLFCVRGVDGTSESNCFAFTESYCGTDEFQLHVFCCEIKEALHFGLMVSIFNMSVLAACDIFC